MHAAFHHVNNFLEQHTGSARRTIAFYSTSPRFAPWEWMAPLAVFLQQKDYRVVLLSTYPMEGIPPALPYFIIDAKEIVHIKNLNCIITMDTDGYGPFPAEARVLAVTHAHAYTLPPTDLANQSFHPERYDGCLVNVPLGQSLEKIKALWTGLLPASAYHRSGARFDILACGYLRTAALQRHLQKDMEPDAICFAPIERSYHLRLNKNRDAFFRKTLHTLFRNFPEYKIIFRPDPTESNGHEVQKIIAEFKGNPRFVPDLSYKKIDTFNRAAVLVTDISHIANSFAFTTLRPAVSFQPWEKHRGSSQTPYGSVSYSLSSLVSTLRTFLEHRETMAQIIRRERDKGTCPPESAFEDFAMLLEGFFAATPPADSNNFISIPRVEPGSTAIEIIEKFLPFPSASSALASVCSRYGFFPDNPLFPAIVFCERCVTDPATAISEALRHHICRFAIPKEAVPATYGEAKELGISLLKLALLQYIKAGDARGKEFCENLIEKYA